MKDSTSRNDYPIPLTRSGFFSGNDISRHALREGEVEGEVIRVRIMKAYRGNRGTAPLIPDRNTNCM
jgi:hypothetical protein